MKTLFLVLVIVTLFVSEACAVNYVGGYTRNDGTHVRGHYRDTSNDGIEETNANYQGYNNDAMVKRY